MAEAAPSLEDVAGVAALLAERKTRLDPTRGKVADAVL
jgi:hypothetical protein